MPAWLNVSLQAAVLIVMLAGLFGLIVPGLPGLVIIWLAGLGYGVAAGFGLPGGLIFAGMTLLMIFGNLVDNLLMGAKARESGASWLSILAALAAGVAGSLLFPPLGGVIAALLAIFLVELARQRDWRKALESMRAMATGCGWAFVARFAIGLVMIAGWAAWAFIF